MHGELGLPFRGVAGQGFAEPLPKLIDFLPVEALELFDQDPEPGVICRDQIPGQGLPARHRELEQALRNQVPAAF
jgi:hypothetical protein